MIRKSFSAILIAIGFLLSPLSWWNDLLINLPLAYLGGVFASFFDKDWFYPGLIFSYWLTNLLGFLLMHWGYKFGKRPNETKKSHKKEILNIIITTIIYTSLIAVLIYFGVLKFPNEYFGK